MNLPAPYWQSDDGTVVLYHGDCLQILPHLSGVDAVVTDPPWGAGINPRNNSRGRGNRPYDRNQSARDFAPIAGDDKPFDPRPLLGYKQAVLWGANHFSASLPSSPFWLVWDRKANKAADSDITDCEIAWTSGTKYRTVRMFSHMWAGFQRDSQAGEQHLHPMEKPVALLQWCMDWIDADTVLDPFMGSGTTGVACVRTGRRFIGIELEERYCAIAKRRIQEAFADQALYAGVK